MPNISLVSFLKILSYGTPEKAREYGKYLTPGGYDFYWQLKDAALEMTVGGKPFDECIQSINGIKNDVERKHNSEGLIALKKWMEGRVVTFFPPAKASCSSVKGYLTVKLEPEFGVVDNGKRQLVQIWNTKSVELKPITAGVGIYLMQQHLLSSGFSDCECVILDLRKGRVLSTQQLPSHIPMMVSSEFAWVDNSLSRSQWPLERFIPAVSLTPVLFSLPSAHPQVTRVSVRNIKPTAHPPDGTYPPTAPSPR